MDDKVPETPVGVPQTPAERMDALEAAAESAGTESAPTVPPWHELGEALEGITTFLLG